MTWTELGLDYCVAGECSSRTAVENPKANPGLVADCEALLAARDMLKGDGNLNWSAEVAIGEWFGVTVEGSPKRVTKLKIGRSSLNGQVAPELGELTKLSVLSLSDNRLSGEIPSELGELTNLKELSLSENRLTGAIPAELGSLIDLSYLFLNNNRLTGEIPSEFGSLAEVKYMRLSDNQLTGEIPSELSSLENLVHLFLRGNQLTGCVPLGLRDVANNDMSLLGLSDCETATGMIAIPGGLGAVFEDLLQRAHDTPFLRRETVGLHSPS